MKKKFYIGLIVIISLITGCSSSGEEKENGKNLFLHNTNNIVKSIKSNMKADWLFDVNNIQEKKKNSDIVIDGNIEKKLESIVDSDTGVVYTGYQINIDDEIKGTKDKKVNVYIPGGVVSVKEYIDANEKTFAKDIEKMGLYELEPTDKVNFEYGFESLDSNKEYMYFAKKKEKNKYFIPFETTFINEEKGNKLFDIETNKEIATVEAIK